VAEVCEHPSIAIEITNGRRSRNDIFQASFGLRFTHHELIISRGRRLASGGARRHDGTTEHFNGGVSL
jgi:hypothetical protein